MEKILDWLTNLGLNSMSKVITFLLILLGGIIVIRIIGSIVNKALSKSKLEKAAHGMIRSLVKTVLYLLLILMAVSSLGVDVTGVLALASVATLAVSLALQDLLSNLVGGFTLVYTHPFSAGDFVEIAGQSGTVKEIGMTYTKLLTPDNKVASIPNNAVVTAQIVNFTVHGTRRVDVAVSAAYTESPEKVLEALKAAGRVEGILEDPAPFAAVVNYGQSAIEYTLRVWCKSDDYWDVLFAVNQNVKKVFAEQGVAMTYPHLNVHLDK
jgi:small conductance mechanosensitive channel